MRKGFLAAIIAISLLAAPNIGLPADQNQDITVREVESAFRTAVTLFAYNECWKLWETATNLGRRMMTQKDFCALMDKSLVRSAAGRQVEEVTISLNSPNMATVFARMGLEPKGGGGVRSLSFSFLFYYEDGAWRHTLSDFLRFASY